jgi:hypothetical protein
VTKTADRAVGAGLFNHKQQGSHLGSRCQGWFLLGKQPPPCHSKPQYEEICLNAEVADIPGCL